MEDFPKAECPLTGDDIRFLLGFIDRMAENVGLKIEKLEEDREWLAQIHNRLCKLLFSVEPATSAEVKA